MTQQIPSKIRTQSQLVTTRGDAFSLASGPQSILKRQKPESTLPVQLKTEPSFIKVTARKPILTKQLKNGYSKRHL